MINTEILSESSVEELKLGYSWKPEEEGYRCLACGEVFPNGIIREVDGVLLDAERTVRHHISEAHGSAFQVLVGLGKKFSGLSEVQRQVVELIYQGKTDKEIAKLTGDKAESTIRNHRYQLREKYKEAKVFMAIKELIDSDRIGFIHFHPHINAADGRIMTTEEEAARIIGQYLDGEKLLSFPKKEKRKMVILQHIVNRLDESKRYSGAELDGILKSIFSDYATIRRYLVDYGFLSRTDDCKEYWVTG